MTESSEIDEALLEEIKELQFPQALAHVRRARSFPAPGADLLNIQDRERYPRYESGEVIPSGPTIRDLTKEFGAGEVVFRALWHKATEARAVKRGVSRRRIAN